MKKETKNSLKNNAIIIAYAIMIIAAVILSDVINLWGGSGTVEFGIILIAFLILSQVFTQALQHEPEKTRNKVRRIISVILIVLFILGIVAFLLVSTHLL